MDAAGGAVNVFVGVFDGEEAVVAAIGPGFDGCVELVMVSGRTVFGRCGVMVARFGRARLFSYGWVGGRIGGALGVGKDVLGDGAADIF